MWCKGKRRGQRLHCRPMRIWREGYIVTEMGRHEWMAWGWGGMNGWPGGGESHSLSHSRSCSLPVCIHGFAAEARIAIPRDDGTQGGPGLRSSVEESEMNVNTWLYVAKGVRGLHATTMSEEETACRRQPGLRCGCQVQAVSSADAEVVEAVKKFL